MFEWKHGLITFDIEFDINSNMATYKLSAKKQENQFK